VVYLSSNDSIDHLVTVGIYRTASPGLTEALKEVKTHAAPLPNKSVTMSFSPPILTDPGTTYYLIVRSDDRPISVYMVPGSPPCMVATIDGLK
jgi:hypothetical protein